MNTEPAKRRDALARLFAQSPYPLSNSAQKALETWLDGIAEYNERIDLTAARTDDELVDLMIADAALLAQHIAPNARVVDVGSGAGAPGLPLSILRPDVHMTLVEPIDKRVAFLRRTLGLIAGRAQVVRGRADVLLRQKQTFDVAISRATLPPEKWLSVGSELAPHVWVLLAQGAPPENEHRKATQDIVYTWPLTGVSRRAVCYSPRVIELSQV
ncbi:MAG: class I SAM-dependent methyltransferase [Polyangiaceae bacterium]|nr:class I SAM-dependent methyltransferase [Polyangiaceae bacterium]